MSSIHRLIILQVGAQKMAQDAVREGLDSGNWSAPIIVLVVLIVLNLILTVASIIGSYIVKQSEVKVFRKNKINEMSINIEADLYTKLLTLHEIPSGNIDELVENVRDIMNYKRGNNLFIKKELGEIVDDAVDYYTGLCYDFSKKDKEDEEKKLKEYRVKFYG